MATDKDKVKIDINIAGEPLRLTVPYEQQDAIRKCEKAINDRYYDWRVRFPRKTNGELLAMLLFQYASYYFELDEREQRTESELHTIADDLDRILHPDREPEHGGDDDEFPF